MAKELIQQLVIGMLTKTPQTKKAFTLIELLIVMAIMAITIGFVIFSVNIKNPSDIANSTDKKITQLLNLAKAKAILTPMTISFIVTDKYYKFQELSSGKWQDIQNNRLLKSYTIPEEIIININVGNNRIVFQPNGEVSKYNLKSVPR